MLCAVVCLVWQVRHVFPLTRMQFSGRNDLTVQIQIWTGSKSTAGYNSPRGLWQVQRREPTKTCSIIVINRTIVTNSIRTLVKSVEELNKPRAHKNVHKFSGSDVFLTCYLTALCSPLPSQWEEVSGLDEENNSVRTYQICQTESSSSHWLRSGFIQRRGASQVYVELRFTMMECSSRSTHHRSCKETFNLYYYQADSNEATTTYPPWMENPYTKVRPHPPYDVTFIWLKT